VIPELDLQVAAGDDEAVRVARTYVVFKNQILLNDGTASHAWRGVGVLRRSRKERECQSSANASRTGMRFTKEVLEHRGGLPLGQLGQPLHRHAAGSLSFGSSDMA
jgi:hypothetical protein